jgi:hypothetical protein
MWQSKVREPKQKEKTITHLTAPGSSPKTGKEKTFVITDDALACLHCARRITTHIHHKNVLSGSCARRVCFEMGILGITKL